MDVAMSRRRPRSPDGAPDGGDPITREAMDALRRIVRALRLASVEVEREVGISVAQLFVLKHLEGGTPRSINELAARTATDPSTVSGVVRRLLDAGLALRGISIRDGRRAEVTLTPRGAALLARAPAVPQAKMVAALGALPPARLKALAAGLVELAAELGAAEAPLFFEDTPPRRRRR
jgi:DNA-binding MarR family transcriptional regulator